MADDFTNLRIWQLGFRLLKKVYILSDQFPKAETYALTDQIRRSANSVTANIAESSGRYHKKDKIKVLYYARGEIHETKSHLLVAKELGYCKAELVDGIVFEYSTLLKQVNTFIKVIAN